MPKAKTAETKSAPNTWLLRLVAIGCALLVIPALIYTRDAAGCSQAYRKDLQGVSLSAANDQSFDIEVVESPQERSRGLSGRSCIGENQGMLFVFESIDKHGFWMKEMNFPIDIVWLDQDKKIVHIVSGAAPESYPTIFTPAAPAMFVLELSSGRSDSLGFSVGSALSW